MPPKGHKNSPETIERIRQSKLGSRNPRWGGDSVSAKAGRLRAKRLYRVTKPCEVCGTSQAERHHRDGNTLNNAPTNIAFLCRKHHMEADGRLAALRERITELNQQGPRDERGKNCRTYVDGDDWPAEVYEDEMDF